MIRNDWRIAAAEASLFLGINMGDTLFYAITSCTSFESRSRREDRNGFSFLSPIVVLNPFDKLMAGRDLQSIFSFSIFDYDYDDEV